MTFTKFLPFLVFLTALSNIHSNGQPCNCDSMVNSKKINWPKWVKNSDSIQMIDFKKVAIIKTKKDKKKIIRLLSSDTLWTAFLVSGKSVTVKLGRYDTLAGRTFTLPAEFDSTDKTRGSPVLLPGDSGPMRHVQFGTKKHHKEFLDENIELGDEYYEIYFKIGSQLIKSPGVCLKNYSYFLDNIIFQLMIKK